MWRPIAAVITLGALLASSCLRVDAARLEHLAQRGEVDALAAVIEDEGTTAELRATAASLLLLGGRERMALDALARLAPDRVAPVAVYLVRHFLPRALVERPEQGRRALLLVRPYGRPEDVARADGQLLDSVSAEVQAAGPGQALSPTVSDVLLTVGPARQSQMLAMLEHPSAPRDLILSLLARDRAALATAHDHLLARLQRQGEGAELPDVNLWRTLAKQGQWRPLAAKFEEGGRSALVAAEALLAAPPERELATWAARRLRQRDLAQPLRGPLLAVLESAGSAAVVPELMAILRRERDPGLGYVVFRAVLVHGGAPAALPALEAFPASISHGPQGVRRHLVDGTRRLLGTAAARKLAIAGLRSASPLARLTAVLLLEQVGAPADATLVRRLADQRSRPRGLGSDDAIGVQATRVSRRLEQGGSPLESGPGPRSRGRESPASPSLAAGAAARQLRSQTGHVDVRRIEEGDHVDGAQVAVGRGE